MVDPEFARNHAVIPLMLDGHNLIVAMADAGDRELVDLLQFIPNHRVTRVAVTGAEPACGGGLPGSSDPRVGGAMACMARPKWNDSALAFASGDRYPIPGV